MKTSKFNTVASSYSCCRSLSFSFCPVHPKPASRGLVWRLGWFSIIWSHILVHLRRCVLRVWHCFFIIRCLYSITYFPFLCVSHVRNVINNIIIIIIIIINTPTCSQLILRRISCYVLTSAHLEIIQSFCWWAHQGNSGESPKPLTPGEWRMSGDYQIKACLKADIQRQTTIHNHMHTYSQSMVPIILTPICMSLDCVEKPEYPVKTHIDTGREHVKSFGLTGIWPYKNLLAVRRQC